MPPTAGGYLRVMKSVVPGVATPVPVTSAGCSLNRHIRGAAVPVLQPDDVRKLRGGHLEDDGVVELYVRTMAPRPALRSPSPATW